MICKIASDDNLNVTMGQLQSLTRHLDRLAMTHPEWQALYEDMATDASYDELMTLANNAPDAFAQGLVVGKALMKMDANRLA